MSAEVQSSPAAEPGELRGPMQGSPSAAGAAAAPPSPQRSSQGLAQRAQDVVVVYPRGGAEWTGASSGARAQQSARASVAAGVRPGDNVTSVAGYHAEYAPLISATSSAGAAWAPLNQGFDDGDFRSSSGVSAPRVVSAPPPTASRSRRLFDASQAEAEEAWAAPRLVASGDAADWEDFSRPAAASPPPPSPPPPRDPLAAPALVCCSSGTSGSPKGVVLSHFNLAAALDAIMHEDSVPKSDCTMLITSPGFWVTGIYYTLISMMVPLKLIYEHGSTEKEVLASVHKYKPSISFTSNNFSSAMAKAHESAPEHDLSSSRTLIPTGAAMSRDAEDSVQRVTGCHVQQIYGMTEVGVVLGSTKHDSPHKTGSVGKVCPFVQCKVSDPETGSAVGAGQEGESCFKGPGVTKGYLKNPRATADSFDEGGWSHSGDSARYDEDGVFFVTGRIKDTIKYRGVHVSPVEIEGSSERHAAVSESAVVGVSDPATEDESPRAYVVSRPGACVAPQELCQVVEDHSAPHKWSRGGVAFVDSSPKTPTGKISRAAIRKRYLENVTIGS